jgi:hypothetical protein
MIGSRKRRDPTTFSFPLHRLGLLGKRNRGRRRRRRRQQAAGEAVQAFEFVGGFAKYARDIPSALIP